jgi:hydroxymethylglutaryl-CoA reductase
MTSRIPGFYRLSLADRRKLIVSSLALEDQIDEKSAVDTWDTGGLTPETADQVVENVLGIYALPLGVALNATINGEDRLIPMVVEEPSVIAATSNACKMIREGGGFFTRSDDDLMIAQIELRKITSMDQAERAILASKAAVLNLARAALPGLEKRGGGPKDIELRRIGDGHLVVHLLVDCCDAMGANLVNTAAEAIGPLLAELSGAHLGLRILSNLSDRRTVRVTAKVPVSSLVDSKGAPQDGARLAEEIEAASIFAERDPYRASTHNKGIMNGIDSVVIATGNDYRAVEAGAHAFASRTGTYAPLSTWRCENGHLAGQMTLPLALGTVGGTLRVHRGARLALSVAQVKGAADLASLAACAGLASNLAALRALSSEGIQRGHMSLHARSVAIFAGAVGSEVVAVAQAIAQAGTVNLEQAKKALQTLRK